MDPPDNYQATYDSKTKIVVIYSLSNAFDLISGSIEKYRSIYYFEIKTGHPVYQLANSYCLYAQRSTPHCHLRRGKA